MSCGGGASSPAAAQHPRLDGICGIGGIGGACNEGWRLLFGSSGPPYQVHGTIVAHGHERGKTRPKTRVRINRLESVLNLARSGRIILLVPKFSRILLLIAGRHKL